MIVVLGVPRSSRDEEGRTVAAGRAVEIATAAVSAGASVELAGRVGDDAAGDAVVLDLADRGIGHAALLRIGGMTTADDHPADGTGDAILAAEDIDLALRYLPTYGVVVATDDLDPAARAAAVEASTWANAALIVLTRATAGRPDDGGPATVLSVPDGEDGKPASAFAALVGAYAAGLDRGESPGDAFADLEMPFHAERLD